MKFLNKMQMKFGRYAIKNLSLYMIAFYTAGYLVQLFFPNVLNYLTLDPYFILRGQVWRLITWVIVPPSQLGLFTIIMLYFYYCVGKMLENTWGAFRYNVYIFSGIIAMIIGAFILYAILRMPFGALFTTYYINMTIFLAFATTYPDVSVYLYFLIPIKMKWLGVFYGVMLLYDFMTSHWIVKIMMVMSMLNFLVYFICTRLSKGGSLKTKARQWEYRKATSSASSAGYGQGRTGSSGPITRHKCAVCGRTELDGDDLIFRFCSKCDGNYEYCQEHIFTHEHVHK